MLKAVTEDEKGKVPCHPRHGKCSALAELFLAKMRLKAEEPASPTATPPAHHVA